MPAVGRAASDPPSRAVSAVCGGSRRPVGVAKAGRADGRRCVARFAALAGQVASVPVCRPVGGLGFGGRADPPFFAVGRCGVGCVLRGVDAVGGRR